MRRVQEDGAFLEGSEQFASTLMCVHCGGHFVREPFSTATLNWCRNCMGPLCDKHACLSECLPLEKWLDQVEQAGRRG